MEPNFQPEIGLNGFEEFEKEVSYVDADNWARFINYVVDILIIYALIFVFAFIGGIIIEITSPGLLIDVDEESMNYKMITYLLFYTIYVLYYTICEGLMGKTLGKFISKTKVIDNDTNVKPTFTIAFIRSLCRLIPLDAISFFFYDAGGWHDRISKTRVVKIAK